MFPTTENSVMMIQHGSEATFYVVRGRIRRLNSIQGPATTTREGYLWSGSKPLLLLRRVKVIYDIMSGHDMALIQHSV